MKLTLDEVVSNFGHAAKRKLSNAAVQGAPEDQLRRVMGEWVAEVKVSANLVVLRTPPGCAHVVASAIDRSGMTGLIGTVAGDDTLMCVAEESMGGKALAIAIKGYWNFSCCRGSCNARA